MKYICSMDTKKAKILVVDDEEALREGLGMYLEFEGYEVDTASSAEEALALDLAKYDLLLLDIMMGGMSGCELAEVLKRKPETASLPIIFLTAKDSDDDVLKGLTLGADDYIAKPYSIKIVMARIEAVLRRTRGSAAAPKVTERPVVCDRQSLTCLGRRLPREIGPERV